MPPTWLRALDVLLTSIARALRVPVVVAVQLLALVLA